MQLILLGSVRSDECVPAYLTASGYQTVRRNRDRIEIREAELIQHLTKCPRGSFGKVHLSNLPDWMDQDQFDTVLRLVNEKIAIRRPGLGWERTYLARRGEEITGVLGAWDTGAFHATRVVSYSAAATIARGVRAAARTVLREGRRCQSPARRSGR